MGDENAAGQGEDPITIGEVAAIARKRLKGPIWDYYDCGADSQIALHENEDAFKALKILPRVLRDVSSVDTRTTLFNRTYPVPFGFAPSAMQKLAGGEGEMDVARASVELGVNLTLSSQSTTSLEDVITTKTSLAHPKGLDPAFWMQLYQTSDPERSIPLIKRAEAAGYEALVLTVDTPVLGNRLNERKVPLVLPEGLRLENFEDASTRDELKHSPASKRRPTSNRQLMDARTRQAADTIIQQGGGATHSSSLTWNTTIPFLRKAAPKMKLILKGILTPEDALLAVKHGADAIVVSNHGGRQLDSASSTIEALPAIHAALSPEPSFLQRPFTGNRPKNKIPIILDGGIRHGSDIFKALALGADFVLIGRPLIWGLAYNGKEGVETVYHILEREFSRTMALAGVSKVADIQKDYIGIKRLGSFGVMKL